MLAVNWLEANLFMIFTTLCLVGIPAVIIYVAFSKHKGASANIEEYKKEQEKEKEKETAATE
jgi:hypothetical protein